jgi:predicted ATPase
MIKSIEIKNFKSIKSKYFPLRNLNVLLGLNGQGKSSFIQSLLLLRQSADSLNKGELKLKGNEVEIGTTKDARYQYSKNDENLFIALQFNDKEPYQMDFDYRIEGDFFKQKNFTTNIYGENEISIDKSQSLFSSNFQYLNAHRIEPKSIHPKDYTSVVVNKNLGKNGDYTAHFIETYYNDPVEFENIIHKNSIVKDEVLGTEIINKTLINQINLWMGEISPGVNIRTTAIPNAEEVLLEYVFKQPNFGNTNRFKPENVGFGISYSLHVVTTLLAARPGELIIIENPESHIHPKGQAKLGELIALVARNDVQIIIETHSDHILNGIRVAVKEDPKLKDRTILFYFNKIITPNEQYSKVTNIEIDRNGTLSEYPEGLLDEWSNQLFKLM